MVYQPERLSLEEIAKRLDEPVSYVQECVRTCQFRYIVFASSPPGRIITDHWFLDRSIWPYEENVSWKRVGDFYYHLIEDPAKKREFCEQTYQSRIFIPLEEVERFEKENESQSDNSLLTLKQVAKIIGKNEKQTRTIIDNGYIEKASNPGKKILVTRTALDKYLGRL